MHVRTCIAHTHAACDMQVGHNRVESYYNSQTRQYEHRTVTDWTRHMLDYHARRTYGAEEVEMQVCVRALRRAHACIWSTRALCVRCSRLCGGAGACACALLCDAWRTL